MHATAFHNGQLELLERIAGGAPLAEILEGIVRIIEAQAEGMVCTILLIDESGIIRHLAAPSLPEDFRHAIDGQKIGPNAGSCGTAAFLGERVIVEDIETHPYWASYKQFALPHGLRACWSTPIFSPQREVLGTFAMYYRVSRGPTDQEIEWVNAATHLASIALEHERSRHELLRSEAEFRVMFESAAIGMALIDADARLTRANPALARMVGYDAAELCRMKFMDFTHPDDVVREMTLFRSLVSGQRDYYRIEKRFIRKDGMIVWGLSMVSFVRRSRQQSSFAIGMIEDISERKRAEAERNRLETQLRHSQRMQALGTLAGGIAHDFNNILTAILGNAQLALLDLSDGGTTRDCLAEIEKAGTRAADLVRQILTFSRQQEPKRKTMALAPIIEEALRLLRATLPAMIQIRFDPLPNLSQVSVDPTQIHQLIMNLCTNATHAIGQEGGMIDIALSEMAAVEGRTDFPGDLAPGRYLRLLVSDSGRGMDKATMERIFEPFFTTKSQGQGTGLGLSVVHGIVTSHGGAISVYSEPGQGTTFQLFFPTSLAEAVAQREPQASATHRGGGQHILYVDDEEALVSLAKQVLERSGYRVTGHTDPIEAYEAFRMNPRSFDALLTDQSMPNMSGLDLIREIRRIRPDLPVLMATGHMPQCDVGALKELGVRELIQKPNSVQDLTAALHRTFAE